LYQSLRFFGGLHDTDIAEIPGVNALMVCRYQAQAKARFRQGLSS
jgi:DNA-directed RNA polymerase specialized sigma subunit